LIELADGKGLIVPVVKHAEGLNLLGMARSVAEIAAKARDKKLLPDDVQARSRSRTRRLRVPATARR
jgi:pyruvate/2-oxoglutarate dehydrogenase complex dihydrolipoamide acyltransferase (E2) component